MGRLILVPYRLLLRVRDIVETGALCTAPDRPMQRDTRGRALIIITGRLEKPEKKNVSGRDRKASNACRSVDLIKAAPPL